MFWQEEKEDPEYSGRFEKDEGRNDAKSRNSDADGLGCDNDFKENMPVNRYCMGIGRKVRLFEKDDAKEPKNDRSHIWMGGGKKSEDGGSKNDRVFSEFKKLGNLGKKGEKVVVDDSEAPPKPEPRPMGIAVYKANYLDLRKRNYHGNSDGTLGQDWTRGFGHKR